MIGKRFLLLAAVAVAIASPAVVRAHGDPNADPTSCDTWQRTGHAHDHPSSSDIPVPVNGGVIYSHTGHHGVRTNSGYVEVVGGGAYRGPDPDGNFFPGQGGYIQGEIDTGAGRPDVDFNVAYFGPNVDDPPSNAGEVSPWVNGQYGKVCVNVAGTQVERETRAP